MKDLSPTDAPEDYVTHPYSFPLILLPFWVKSSLGEDFEDPFDADLIYSTLAGYYFIRLLDNVMDEKSTVESGLLPVAGFLHFRFTGMYHRYFEPDHPFWVFFENTWNHSVEVTVRDAYLEDIDEAHFREICGQKFCASKIPVAAVCHRYGRVDRIEPWVRFLETLGCWHQMANDYFGWHKDQGLDLKTFFLSEGRRRMHSGESDLAWFLREGFDWGAQKLDQWMLELMRLAKPLDCPPLEEYLEIRRALHRERLAEATEGRRAGRRLLEILAGGESPA
jgi:hypothetical protein